MKIISNIFPTSRLPQPSDFFLMPMFLMILISFSTNPSSVYGQTTAEVCRETNKVQYQYFRDLREAKNTLNVFRKLSYYSDVLSELAKAVRGGFVLSGLRDLEDRMRTDIFQEKDIVRRTTIGSSSKEQLDFQRTVYDSLKQLVDKASEVKDDQELIDRIDQLVAQVGIREKRLIDLDCSSVLERERTSPELPDITGAWICTAKCPAGGEGKTASISGAGSTLTFTNEGGGKSAGRYESSTSIAATDWGLTATVLDEGKTIKWSNGTVWVKQ